MHAFIFQVVHCCISYCSKATLILLRGRAHRRQSCQEGPLQQCDLCLQWATLHPWTWVCERQWLRTYSCTTSSADGLRLEVRVVSLPLDSPQSCTGSGTYSWWRVRIQCLKARRRTCHLRYPWDKDIDVESLSQVDLHRSQQRTSWTFLSWGQVVVPVARTPRLYNNFQLGNCIWSDVSQNLINVSLSLVCSYRLILNRYRRSQSI